MSFENNRQVFVHSFSSSPADYSLPDDQTFAALRRHTFGGAAPLVPPVTTICVGQLAPSRKDVCEDCKIQPVGDFYLGPKKKQLLCRSCYGERASKVNKPAQQAALNLYQVKNKKFHHCASVVT